MIMRAKNATEISQQAQIKLPGKDYLAMAQNARQYADLLIENHLWTDAIAYLSHAITPREGIWWAWFCARKASLPKSDAAEIKALGHAEAWIAQPTEENRKQATLMAERLPSGSPAQCVMQAIVQTGETENEMTGDKIPVIPYMANKFIQVAVISSIYAIDHEKPETIANEFLRQGLEVANRIQLWAKYA